MAGGAPAPQVATPNGRSKIETQKRVEAAKPATPAAATPTPVDRAGSADNTLFGAKPVGAKPVGAKPVGAKPVAAVAPSNGGGASPKRTNTAASSATATATAAGDDSGRRNWLAIGIVGAACALAGTFLLGVVVGGSGGGDSSDGESAGSASTTVTTSSPATTAVAEASDGVTQADLDDATARVDELETREDELDGRVVALEEELGAVSAEADNLAEHNRLLQTWFTSDVLARSQSAWDGEVARVCQLAETPTIDDVSYIRALEVIGTPTDLLEAALDCRQGAG